MSWNEITLNQFEALQSALKIEDETERLISISEIVFGENVTELPIGEYTKKVKELSFLQIDVPNDCKVKGVSVNGRDYDILGLLGNISTAQYIDYTNHMKEGKTANMLSVFFVPKGHKYNDGYDMLQVISDIGCMPITIVNSTAFFFTRQLELFMRIFQSSLKKQIRKMKLPKEQKQLLMDGLQHLESYPIFSSLLK